MKQKLGILAAVVLSLAVAGSTFAAGAKPNVKQNQTTAPAKTTMMAKTTKAKSKSKRKAKSKKKMAKSTKMSSKAATTKK